MSLQIDWVALTPIIMEKLQEIVESIPEGVNPMLKSKIKFNKLFLGDQPPHIAISKITSLHYNEQILSLVFRYEGNAELEVSLDINANSCSVLPKQTIVARHMGTFFTDAPLNIRCRALLSSFQISLKIELNHGEKTFIRFEEPPTLKFTIDSNFSHLGPIFLIAFNRIKKVIKKIFNSLPEKIEIGIPEKL
ncbi:hypothetical protein GPJ56_006014 [Histomonas meleagridis]|uniref:uncharacterized protein n=1 Tax=Histomonas meleagridis TaxID=135588 RepID=UPI00355A605F|nr:hypothetical protein GPJ56_006014 [Histomonas meleagridis]KAH0799421.1 hypothetical protein GO595_007822 [Histomonas meleagridis]